MIWDETVGAGGYAVARLPRGAVLRIADADGDACVHLLVLQRRATRPSGSTSPTPSRCSGRPTSAPGALLLSDMGRVLMTIVADTSARHDALCGGTSRARSTTARYGDGRHPRPPPRAPATCSPLAAAKLGLAGATSPPASTCSSR